MLTLRCILLYRSVPVAVHKTELRLDRGKVDWAEVGELIKHSYVMTHRRSWQKRSKCVVNLGKTADRG